ncbi:MAG: hypothetical protein IPJ65_18865 [Archangiaceae bacterium]|nr:hypothetical protein [Archangiaceae bacterium]
MKNLLIAAVIALTGCGLGGADEYRNAVPKSDTVQMKVPGSTGQALETASSGQALEGDKAAFYQVTRGVSLFVNGAGYQVLTLVKTITEYPPTTLDEEKGVAVWGPYTEALSPNTWRMTVTKKADKDFTYVLEAKAKTAGDDAFLTILSGEHVSTGKVTGHGNFTLDMDKAQQLPEHDADAFGKAEYVYTHDALDDTAEVEATFTQVKDHDSGRFVNATYKYASNEQTGGKLEFQFQGDIDAAKNTALENMTLNSRWDRSGAGRSDVKVAGGDLASGQTATATECWDSSFASRYLNASFDPSLNYGSESACGNLSTAEYSTLRL